METFEKLDALLSRQDKQVFTTAEIKDLMFSCYRINKGSVIPSDYCYNRTNNGIAFDQHILEFVRRGEYKYLGRNYRYTGKIYHHERGCSEAIVGEWNDGLRSFYDTPRQL